MPPCAATVCERVGKTLVMQAVLSPASLQPSVGAEARAAGADHDDVEGVVGERIGAAVDLAGAAAVAVGHRQVSLRSASFRIAKTATAPTATAKKVLAMSSERPQRLAMDIVLDDRPACRSAYGSATETTSRRRRSATSGEARMATTSA